MITLKGTWECFLDFLKIIWSLISAVWKFLNKIYLFVYFAFGFYLFVTKQVMGDEYLFIGLYIVYLELSNKPKN
jgi:hypothetical protein